MSNDSRLHGSFTNQNHENGGKNLILYKNHNSIDLSYKLPELNAKEKMLPKIKT